MPQNPRNAGRQPFCCIFHRSTRFWCQINYFYYIGITRSVKPQSSPRPWDRQAVGRIIPPRPVGGEDFKAECPIVRQQVDRRQNRQGTDADAQRRTFSEDDFFFRNPDPLSRPRNFSEWLGCNRMIPHNWWVFMPKHAIALSVFLNNRAIRANGKQDRQTQSRSVFAATASGRKPPGVCSCPCVAVPSCALSNCEPSENDDRKRLTAG